MTTRPAPAPLAVSPELADQLGGLIRAVRSISHGPLSSLDGEPVEPMGLEALGLAVDRHGEAVASALGDVASALRDVANAVREATR